MVSYLSNDHTIKNLYLLWKINIKERVFWVGLTGTAVLLCFSGGEKYIRTETLDALLGNLKSSLHFFFLNMSVK